MKIFIAVDSVTGGAGSIAKVISSYFCNEGECVYLYYKNARSSEFLVHKNLKVVLGDDFSSFRSFHREVYFLYKKIGEIKPDVIISFLNTVSPQVLISQLFSKIPVIVSERSNPFQNVRKSHHKLIRSISYLRANKIVVQFEAFKKFNFLAYKLNRLKVIPNMILHPTVIKTNYSKNSSISFVTVSSIYSVKRIDLMINIFARIHNEIPLSTLNIYGVGVDELKLKQLVKDLCLNSSVFFHGRISDVYNVLHSHDIYLMTSEREGFPNALCEAMAVGLPTISFKCHEGLDELVQNSINGFLIEEGNVNDYSIKILELAKDSILRERIGKAAQLITEKYDINRIMRMWIECIKEVK